MTQTKDPMSMTGTKHWIWLGVLVAVPLALGGCDFGETRPFNYKKGTYLGKAHEPIDEATLMALRERTVYQSDAGTGGSTGGGPSPNVRPPASSTQTSVESSSHQSAGGTRPPPGGSKISTDALRERAAHQRSF